MSNLDLSLWKHRLGAVPDHVWDRTELRTLVLADNDLVEISDRVGELRALKMLDVGHNKLRRLPESLGQLSGLSDFLYLHDNALMELPASLKRLTRCAPPLPSTTRLPVPSRSIASAGVR